MQDYVIEALRQNPVFANLSEQDLTSLVQSGKRLSVQPGTCLIQEGDPGDSWMVVLKGEVQVVRNVGDGEANLARVGPGTSIGEMALIDNGTRTATVRSITPVDVLVIRKEEFDHLLRSSSDACICIIQTILQRQRSTEAMLVNQEKLAALGRLSAGLAHELNNPASALQRSVSHLTGLLSSLETSTVTLSQNLAPAHVRRIQDRLITLQNMTSVPGSGSPGPLARMEQEEALARWLTEKGVEQSWELAADLANANWQPGELEPLVTDVPDVYMRDIVTWLATASSLRMILDEMQTSAERMSQIVSAVKRYSHMDRAPIEQLNVNHGIEATLVILRHKMKEVTVDLDLDPNLPEIEGYTAELNQVWTNLIDNAVDAMHGKGTLDISTQFHDDMVQVQITDNGSGIDEKHLNRLFEPFFTTKAVGSGTGLGLHIAHNIVAQRHHGTIAVSSELGNTVFTVRLPLRQDVS